jgi:hypothetical protein
MEFLLANSRFDEIWLQDSRVHLDDKSTREKEFEVSI